MRSWGVNCANGLGLSLAQEIKLIELGVAAANLGQVEKNGWSRCLNKVLHSDVQQCGCILCLAAEEGRVERLICKEYHNVTNSNSAILWGEEYFKVHGDQAPLVLGQTNDGEKYLKPNVEPDQIATWVKDFKDGKLKPFLSSEPIPENNSLINLVGDLKAYLLTCACC
nr:protein disulfide-isomerase-like [Ipomoea batatas]